MGFLNNLKSLFSADQASESGQWIYARCQRCGEPIKTRLSLQNDLSLRDEGGYVVHKTLVGSQLCFQRIEIILYFDQNRRLTEREITHGDFITAEEFEAAQSA